MGHFSVGIPWLIPCPKTALLRVGTAPTGYLRVSTFYKKMEQVDIAGGKERRGASPLL